MIKLIIHPISTIEMLLFIAVLSESQIILVIPTFTICNRKVTSKYIDI